MYINVSKCKRKKTFSAPSNCFYVFFLDSGKKIVLRILASWTFELLTSILLCIFDKQLSFETECYLTKESSQLCVLLPVSSINHVKVVLKMLCGFGKGSKFLLCGYNLR